MAFGSTDLRAQSQFDASYDGHSRCLRQPFMHAFGIQAQWVKFKLKTRLLLWCAGLLALAYLMPNHYSPWLSFHGEVVAALAFAPLMVWAALRRGPIPALALGALALALVPVAQVVLGQVFLAGDGWMVMLYLLGFALVALAGSRLASEALQTPQTLQGLNLFWGALVLAAYVSVAIALQQWLGQGGGGIYRVDLPPGGRPFANLAQPNQLATLLLLALAAHVALFEAGRLRAGVALLGVLFLVCGLVLTGSRTVLLALVWLWPAYAFMRRRCGLRTQPAAVVGASLFFAAVSALWPFLNQMLLLSVDVPTAFNRLDSPGARTVFWTSMLDAVSRAPWQGYGWAQIGLAQTETALEYPAVHEYFYSSHNLFLDLLLWNGVPLGLSVIVGLLAWLVWQLRQCRDPLSWSAMVAIGFVFSHAMVEYPLEYAYFLLPVGFLMGILSAVHPSRADKMGEALAPKLQRVALAGVAGLALAVIVKVVVEYPVWEQDWRYLKFQEARIGEPERGELPSPILLTQLDGLMKFSRAVARPGMSGDELEWMRRVSGRFGHASGMYRYALALALNHRPVEARMALRRLCQMQSKPMCLSAQREWADMARDKYSQLAQIPFPIPDAK